MTSWRSWVEGADMYYLILTTYLIADPVGDSRAAGMVRGATGGSVQVTFPAAPGVAVSTAQIGPFRSEETCAHAGFRHQEELAGTAVSAVFSCVKR